MINYQRHRRSIFFKGFKEIANSWGNGRYLKQDSTNVQPIIKVYLSTYYVLWDSTLF